MMNHEKLLIGKGWKQNADGSWSKIVRPNVVVGLHAAEPELDPGRSVKGKVLDEGAREGRMGKRNVARPAWSNRRGQQKPVASVTLVAFVRRERDWDNLVGGFKHLRDAIALSLRIDDGDRRVSWQYGQVVTHGRTGTMVRIEQT